MQYDKGPSFTRRIKFFFAERVTITKEAIELIPFIPYKGLAKSENDAIFQNVRNVLKISKYLNFSREVHTVLVPSKSKKKRTVLGDSMYVNLGRDKKTCSLLFGEEKVVEIHNHPNCSDFSIADINTFLLCESLFLSIIVTNVGDIAYIQKNNDYNEIEANKYFLGLGKENKNNQNIANIFLVNASSFGITYKFYKKD